MRKNKAIKNIIANLTYYCLNAVLGLVGRKFFCDYITSDIVGLNGLLTSVISMLSLAELGMGTAIGYQLYRPLAEFDYKKVSSIMNFFKKAYYVLGCSVFGLGILALPFLDLIVADNSIEMPYVYMVYFIFLFDTVISYFFSYRRVLLSSDQKEFKIKCIDIVVLVVTILLQCIVLVTTENYILYLLVRVFCVLAGNLYTYVYVGKRYPHITEKNIARLTKEDRQLLNNDVKSLFIMKIAIYCVSGTDNLLLSYFIGLEAVAVYSNYSLIILTVTNVFGNIFSSITANLGNYIISEDKDSVYALYKKILFINFVIAAYMAISMVTVFNYFMPVWVGDDYLWPIWVVAILVLNNYMSMIRKSTEAFRCAAGLFAPKPILRYVALFEGILNVVASVIFVKVFSFGISGVFLGTSISTLVTTIVLPWMVYKYLFGRKTREYFGCFLKYFIITGVLAGVSFGVMNLLETNFGILNVILAVVISFLVTILGIGLLYKNSDEFKYWKEFATSILMKIKVRRD